MDAGVSFRSVHDPGSDLTYTVISNTTDGAWPLARLLAERLDTESMLRIAIVGGGGMIGQRIVREALARGHRVTLVVRDPTRVAEAHERLKVVRRRARSAALAEQLDGHDVVVSAVGRAAATPEYSLYLEAADSLVSTLRGSATLRRG